MLTSSQSLTISAWLGQNGIPFECNVRMSCYSYMRTGGAALFLVSPHSSEQVSLLIQFLSGEGISYKIIGATSNILFLDDSHFSILISTLGLKALSLGRDGVSFFAGSGVMIPDLSRFALLNSLSGFEGLEGIPGSVGGGVYMNAGAYGYEFSQVVVEVEAVDEDGRIVNFGLADLCLRHRGSTLRHGNRSYFVTNVQFRGIPANDYNIYHMMEIFHAKRHRYQDFLYPNLGSLYSGNVYRALAKRDLVFFLCLSVFSFLGYKVKLLGRESPVNRRWINRIAAKRFGLPLCEAPYSEKTLNCLINRGRGTSEMLQYIKLLDRLIGDEIPIENEIVGSF